MAGSRGRAAGRENGDWGEAAIQLRLRRNGLQFHAVNGTVVCSDIVQPRGQQHVVCITRNVQDEKSDGTGFCLSMPPEDQSVCLYPDAYVSVDDDDPTANIMFSMKPLRR